MKIPRDELQEISSYLSVALQVGMISLVMPREREIWHKTDFEPCEDESSARELLRELGAGYQVTQLWNIEQKLRWVAAREDLAEMVDVAEMESRRKREVADLLEQLKENGLWEPALENKLREFLQYGQDEDLVIRRQSAIGQLEFVVDIDLDHGSATFRSLGVRMRGSAGAARKLMDVPLGTAVEKVAQLLQDRDLHVGIEEWRVEVTGSFLPAEQQRALTISRLEDQLRAIGLYEKGIGEKITSGYLVEGSQRLNIELFGGRGKVEVQVSAMPPHSSLDLVGYQVLVRKDAPEISHLVIAGVDTAGLENKFAVIDYRQIDPVDFKGYGLPTGNVHYDHLLAAMDELAELYDHQGKQNSEDELNMLRNGIYIKYGAGNGFEEHLVHNHRGWKDAFYERFSFPPYLHIGVLKNEENIHRLGELVELAWSSGPKTREIMNANNLEQLKEEMNRLGFSENLIGQMEAKMAMNEPRFILYDELQGDKGRVELALHFNQSRTSEYYYFNKFDVVREVQPPLAPGEKYFVSSQRQGEDVQLKEFEMPSLAVKEFNARMEASKDIRGAAQLYAGVSLESSKELATMADGKLIDVDKEFYKTLRNPAPAQTFYLEKGNGFTLSQAVNLLSGRSVYREDMLNVQKNEFTAWTKLDFDVREKSGNFHVKHFSEGYGYDLSAVLDRYDLLELKDPKSREAFEAALKNGDMAPATVELNGRKEAILVVAVPEFKQVNMYSLEGKSIKRESVAVQEKLIEVGVEKGKGVEKSNKKQQGEGLSV